MQVVHFASVPTSIFGAGFLADAFISYSRIDLEFALRLEGALIAAGQTVWLDKNDIPAAAPWLPEVQSGIDSADNFIFILSPDSVVSDPCMQELAHAISNGKRLIPICYRKPEQATVPIALAPINYIFFNETAEFDAALTTLVAAMHTDLDWVRSHTRLQVRALEWQAKSNDKSYLLGGSDLREAEAWLGRSASQPIKPTELQSQYIAASRTAATRAQRRNLTIATVVAVVASALAIVAVIQYFKAKRETVVAEHQTRIATSGRLAATAISLKDAQFDVASLLGIEAGRVEPTLDSLNAQATLFQTNPDLITYLRQPSLLGTNLTDVAFSPDGRRFATATFGGEVTLWDAGTVQAVSSFSTSEEGVATQPRLAFGRDGSTLAMAEPSGAVQVWKIAGVPAVLIEPNASGIPLNPSNVAFDSTGKLLAAGGANGVQVWNLGALQTPLRPIGNALKDFVYIYGLAFSPSDSGLLASAYRDTIHFEDAVSGRSRGEIEFPSSQTGGKGKSMEEDSVRSGALAFSADGSLLAAGQGHPVNGAAKEINGDGTRPAFGRGHGGVSVWRLHKDGDAVSGTLQGTLPLGDDGNAAAVVFRPDGRELITASEEGAMRRWDAGSLKLLREYPQNLLVRISSVAFSPDGSRILSALGKDVFLLWSDSDLTLQPAAASESPGLVTTLSSQSTNATSGVAVTSASGVSALFTSTGLELYGRHPTVLLSDNDSLDQIAISPDGQFVAASHGDGTWPPSRQLWDISQPVPRVVPMVNNDGDAHAFAFSPVGDLLALGSDNGISLFDAKTGRLMAANLDRNRSIIKSIAFSADNSRIAVILDGGAVLLLDGVTLRQLGAPVVPASGVPYDSPSSAAFSKDGQTLFIRNGSDHTVMKWSADPKDWTARACRVAGRNLSLDEWRRYIGDTIPYHRTCSQFPDGEGVAK